MVIDTTDKYAVQMMCLNCFQRVRMWFPKGQEIMGHLQCPTCECRTLSTLTSTRQTVEEFEHGNWLVRAIDTFFNRRKA